MRRNEWCGGIFGPVGATIAVSIRGPNFHHQKRERDLRADARILLPLGRALEMLVVC